MSATRMAPPSDPIIATLIVRQSRCGLSDLGFAAALGISRQLWQATRTGRKGVGLLVLKAILRTYPDLTDDVIAYLSNGSKEEAPVREPVQVPRPEPRQVFGLSMMARGE